MATITADALLVAGTASDAGKSVVVAGLCRLLARRGMRVAPFKAQNMSNNSVVTLDGGEIGRAQALQARACGLEPSVRFNPVLLKPGSDRRSQLVVRGRAIGEVGARDYLMYRESLRQMVAAELSWLRDEYDYVICEGAGSPAEINLRSTDIANMGLAREADIPVVVVGDIDRGGVLAHLFGTVAIMDPADRALVKGFVINKFRGDETLLQPGLEQLRELTGLPTFGVIPYRGELWLDAEDSLGAIGDAPVGRPGRAVGAQWLTIAAIRFPRISNATDVEALACEPGVAVRWATDPSRLADADLVVLPGSKSTVADLAWLRDTGIADALVARVAEGRPVFAVCGGYQMLGRSIVDGVESGIGEVRGLGLLDLEIRFEADKVLRRVDGTSSTGIPVHGYEIHHGRVVHNGDPSLLRSYARLGGTDSHSAGSNGAGSHGAETWAEGSDTGVVLGTHWHGLLESDEFRRALLRDVAERCGKSGFVVATDTSVAAVREAQLDLLADLVERHVDVAALLALPAATPVNPR